MNTPIKVIITGTTGMVGEGVLHVCLQHPQVEKILIINRKTAGITHPKLTEIIQPDFYDLSSIEDQLSGYNACFFCLGISSVGVDKETYYKVTYTLTMHVGETLSRLNRDMVFCYVSGVGTDEEGRSNWARVKGKTENDLAKLPFKKMYAYRPGFIKPIKGLLRIHPFYKYINWLFPIGKIIYPDGFNTLEEIGLSMIHLAGNDYNKPIITGKDISQLAKEEK
jgi:uncharacterized protein YbjT (DUF2867 family)